ncbi:MAG: universal stress protein [Nitrospirota bacterium]
MGGYREILVAVDGSPSSTHALKESFKLAYNEGSWITVVSVAPPYEGDLAMTAIGNIQKAIKEPCEKALLEAEKMAEAERVLIKTVCEEGEPYERIVDLADAENCDLIVLGRRGMHYLERALIGSVTARVIGHSRRDVLVVPLNATVGWKKIFLPVDGSIYSMAAANSAINFAKAYGGELMILAVVDVTEEFMARAPAALDALVRSAKDVIEDIKKKAEASDVKAVTLVREGEAFRVITEIAREQKVDITIMGSHGRTGLKRLLMGSVTEGVIGHATCPVLVVKA